MQNQSQFSIGQTTFVNDAGINLCEFNKIEKMLRTFYETFDEYAQKYSVPISSSINLGGEVNAVLFHNSQNVSNPYVRFFTNAAAENLDTGYLSCVSISQIPDVLDKERFKKILRRVPGIVNYSAVAIDRFRSSDLWQFCSMQTYADKLDEYGITGP